MSACDSDLQLETKAVDVPCESNALHPDCQEQLSAKGDGPQDDKNLPPKIKQFTLAFDATDGYINAKERQSDFPAYEYDAIKGVIPNYTGWITKSVACDDQADYSLSKLPAINTLPGDGEYYVCVKLSQETNDRFAYGRTPLILADFTYPVIEDIPTLSLGKLETVAAKVTERSAAIFLWTKVEGPGEIVFGSADQATTTVAAIETGSYVLALSVTDIVGNQTRLTVNMKWDTTVPTFVGLNLANAAADGYINQTEAKDLTTLYSLDAQGYQTASYTKPFQVQADTVCKDSLNYDQASVPSVKDLKIDGAYSVCVKLTNQAGVSTYGLAKTVTRDTVLPTGTLALQDVAADGFLNAADHTSTSGITKLTTNESGGTITYGIIDTTKTCGEATFGKDLILANAEHLTTGQLIRICGKMVDAAGNIAYLQTADLITDYVAPAFTTFALAGDVADETLTASEKTLSNAMAALMASDFDLAQYKVVLADQDCSVVTTYGDAIPLSSDSAVNAATSYKVCARLADTAGNVSYAQTKSFNNVNDNVPPTVVLTAAQSNPSNSTTLNITASFSEAVTGFDISDITVANGTKGNFATVSSSVYTFDVTGASSPATIDIAAGAAADTTGNLSLAATQLAMTIDTSIPTPTITSAQSGPTNVATLNMTVTFDEDVTGFDLSDITVANGTKGNFSATSATVYTFDITSPSGAVTVDIPVGAGQDSANNQSNAATQFAITADAVPPTPVFTATQSSPTNASTINMTVTFDDVVTGFSLSDLTIANGTAGNFIAVSTSIYTFDITSPSGTVTADINAGVAADDASNNNLAATQFSIVYDNTKPTPTITSAQSSPTNATTLNMTVTFDEAVTGFDLSDITVANGTKGNFNATSSTVYTFDITAPSGAVTVDVAANTAQDSASNNNNAATQFAITYDGTAPTPTITSVQSDPTNASTLNMTVTFDEAVTGFDLTDITIANGTKGNFSATSSTVYTFDITSPSGTVTVDVPANGAIDAASNNNNAATQFSIVHDNVGSIPTITATQSSPTNATTINMTVTFDEAVTGFALADLSIGNGTPGNFNATSSTVYTFDITSPSGTVTADISAGKANDTAGNNNQAATQFSIVFDNTKPTPTITATQSSPTNATTINMTVTFDEAVTGFDLTDITVANGTKGNFNATSSTVYTFDVTSPSGSVTVDVGANGAQDTAGNNSNAATQFAITYDGTGAVPTITSLQSDPTNATTINMTVTFNEAVTGFDLTDITVANGTKGNFNATSSTVYTFDITSPTGTVTADVPANGAVDAATNNNSAATQFSIVYDNTAPTPTITSAQSSPSNATTLNMTVTFDEAVTGFDLTDITVGNGTKGNFNATSSTVYTFDITSPSGSVTVDIPANKAQDSASNNNDAATQFTINSDTTGPQVSAVSASTANGSYKAGDTIDVTVTFDEVVNVVGTPQITLENGSSNAVVDYTSGSGGTTLTFQYTVGASDTSNDLDYVGVNSLAQNGGSTIRDTAGNDATLTLVIPGASGSIGDSKAIIIDTTAPTATTSGEPTGTSATTTLDITVAGTGVTHYKHKVGDTAGIDCSVSGGYGAETAVGTKITDDISGVTNSNTVELCVIGRDLAGNWQTEASATIKTWIKDTTAATATVSGQPTGESKVTVLDITVAGSSIDNYMHKVGVAGSTDCSNSSGYSGSTVVATKITDNISGLAEGTIKLCVVGQHTNTTWQPYASATSVTWTKDTTASQVTGVTSTTADGAYKAGDAIVIQVNFDENVTVSGTPQLVLETGGTDQTINYASGSGTSTLVFNYTVQAGDTNSDLDYVANNSLTGTITDAATNTANLTLANPNTAGSLRANKDLDIDTTTPSGTIVLASNDPYENNHIPAIALTESGSASEYQLCGNSATAGNNCSTVYRAWATYTASPAAYNFGSDGAKTLYVQFRDTAGNISATYNDSITLDSVNPNAASGVSFPSYAAATSATLTWTDGTDGVSFSTHNIRACTNSNCTTGCVGDTTDNASTGTVGSMVDGTSYYGCVQSVDTATNTSGWAVSTGTITIDTTDPGDPTSVSVLTHTNTDFNITFTAGSETNATDFNIKACTASNCTSCVGDTTASSSPGTISAGALSNGTSYYGCVQGQDLAGNTSNWVASAATILFDTTAPSGTVNLAGGDTYENNHTPAIALTRDADATQYQLCGNSATAGNNCTTVWRAWDIYSASPSAYNFGSDGAKTLYVQFRDAAGNIGATVNDTITLDTVLPVAPSGVSFPTTVNTTSATLTWTDGSDAVSFSTHNIRACTSNNCTTGCVGDTTDTASTGTVGSMVDGNSYYGCVQSVDSAANVSAWVASASTIAIDTTPPTFTSLALANEAADGYINDEDDALSSDLGGTLTASGHDNATYLLIKDTTTCNSGAGSFGAMPKNNSAVFTTEENYRICVKLTDNAGNEAYGESSQIGYDVTDPAAATSPVWSEGTSHHTTGVTSSWTKSTDGNLGSQSLQYYSDGTCSTSTGGAVAKLSTDTTDSFTGSDLTTYSYKVTSTDSAGNTSVSACSTAMAIETYPTVTFSPGSTTIAEPTGDSVTITATLSKTYSGSVTIPYTVGGTATSGSDHNLSNGNIVITTGNTTGDITLTVLSDSVTDELIEYASIVMGTLTNGIKGTPSVAGVTITESIDTLEAQTYTADAAVTIPAGTWDQVTAKVWGGGGGGGPRESGNTGGLATGGAGGYASKLFTIAGGESYAIVMGYGGENGSCAGYDGGVGAYAGGNGVYSGTGNNGAGSGTGGSGGTGDGGGSPGGAGKYGGGAGGGANGANHEAGGGGGGATAFKDGATELIIAGGGGGGGSLEGNGSDYAGDGGTGCGQNGENGWAGGAKDPGGGGGGGACYCQGGCDDSGVGNKVTPYNSAEAAGYATGGQGDNYCDATRNGGQGYVILEFSKSDTTAPNAATSLSWSEGTTHNSLTITAQWTKSTSGDLASQQLRVYKDQNCFDLDGTVDSINTSTQSQAFTASTDYTTYYFKIRSQDSFGHISDSSCSTGITVNLDSVDPTVGGGGTITTSSITSSGVTLNWTQGTDNVTSVANLQYEVRYSTSNNISTVADAEANGTITQAYTSADSSHAVTGLAGNTTYYFNVIVKDEANNKVVYNTVSATTTAQAAAPDPTSPSASADSQTAITVSWTSGGGTTAGYKIAWAATTAPANCSSGTVIPSSSITGVNHQVTGLATNTTYGFRICAENGNSTPDVSSGVTVTGSTDNAAPANAPATFEPLPGFTGTGVPLSWTSGGGNTTGYVIYRQDTGTGDITWTPADGTTYTTSTDITGNTGADSSSKIVYVGSATSTTDELGLVDNKTYMYKVFAHNDNTTVQYTTGIQRFSRTYPYMTIDVGNYTTCATRHGRLRCWGGNGTGQLGYGDTNTIGDGEYPYEAGDVNVGKEVLTARVGFDNTVMTWGHVCALTVEGKIRCWGYGGAGRLGTNAITNLSSPPASDVPLEETDDTSTVVIMVDSGGGTNCVITNKGKVRCFGYGTYGALGNDSVANKGVSGTQMEDLPDISLSGSPTIGYVTVGSWSACVVTTDNKGRCWGRNQEGALGQDSSLAAIGDGLLSGRNIADVDDIAVGDIVSISTHSNTVCAVTASNAARCWGDAYRGRLGYGNETDISNGTTAISAATDIDVDATSDTIVQSVVATGVSTCMINTSGQLKCWGQNENGSAGYGDTTIYGDATDYPSGRTAWFSFPSKVVQVAGGTADWTATHNCALLESGEIYCWGEASNGALGNQSTEDIGNDEESWDIAPVPVWGPPQASPDKIRPSNLVHWYDASDLTTLYTNSGCSTAATADGDTIACWQDKSGNGYHVTQTDSNETPVLRMNAAHGLPVLVFDGDDDVLHALSITNGFTGNQHHSIFAVVKSTSGDDGAQHVIFRYADPAESGTGDISQIEWDHSGNKIKWGFYSGDSYHDEGTEQDLEGTTTIISAIHSGGSSNTKKLFVNGDDGHLSHDSGITLTLETTDDVNIGNRGDATNGFKGEIMEVIVYNDDLTDTDRYAIESYLRAKWQKGLDGIATNRMMLHVDPMKRETMKTDTNATSCDEATHTTAADGDDISCLIDRSPVGNDLGQATIGDRPAFDVDGTNSLPALSFTDNAHRIGGNMTGFNGGDDAFGGAVMIDDPVSTQQNIPLGIGDASNTNEKWTLLADDCTEVDSNWHNNSATATGLDNFCTGSTILSYSYNSQQITTSNHLIYLNSTQLSMSGGSSSSGALASEPQFYLGGHFQSKYYGGELTESFFFGRPIAQTETVENVVYMERKWNQVGDNAKAPGGVHHGLVLWLDADDSTNISTDACSSAVSSPSDGNSISCWKDKSGRANHLGVHEGSPSYQINQFNAKPVVRFAGSENLKIDDLIGMSGGDEPFTVFAVASRSQTASLSILLSFGDTSTSKSRWHMTVNANGEYKNTFSDAHTDSSMASGMDSANTQTILTMSYNSSGVANTANQMIYENGRPMITTASGSGSGDAAIPVTPSFRLGTATNNSDDFEGDIAEVVVFNRLLSDAERQDVEAYLAQKWMDEPFARSCQELYRQGQTTDGNYTIDVDGYNGPRAPMTATCDFITSGNGQGGWTLVMNYVRDSTNSTNTRSALYHRLPLMVSNTLGDNESGHATAWGHAAPALFADINFDAIRVNCKDGSHSRVVDFSTTSSQMISLFTTGKGQITAFADFTQLADHTANMGSSSVSGLGTTDAVDEVMGHWMQGGSGNEFTAGGLSGGTLTWECDNNSQTHTNDTIHRFWVK